MVAERGICVNHSTIHRGVVHFSPLLADRFTRRKRAVNGRWDTDQTDPKVRGQWTYLSIARLTAVAIQSNSSSASIAIFVLPNAFQKGVPLAWPARTHLYRRQTDQPGSDHPVAPSAVFKIGRVAI
jgi:hypothetical protein